jgi:hypothetical protein
VRGARKSDFIRPFFEEFKRDVPFFSFPDALLTPVDWLNEMSSGFRI